MWETVIHKIKNNSLKYSYYSLELQYFHGPMCDISAVDRRAVFIRSRWTVGTTQRCPMQCRLLWRWATCTSRTLLLVRCWCPSTSRTLGSVCRSGSDDLQCLVPSGVRVKVGVTSFRTRMGLSRTEQIGSLRHKFLGNYERNRNNFNWINQCDVFIFTFFYLLGQQNIMN